MIKRKGGGGVGSLREDLLAVVIVSVTDIVMIKQNPEIKYIIIIMPSSSYAHCSKYCLNTGGIITSANIRGE